MTSDFYKGFSTGAIFCGLIGSAVLAVVPDCAVAHPVHEAMPDEATVKALIEDCEKRNQVDCYIVVGPDGPVAVTDHMQQLTK